MSVIKKTIFFILLLAALIAVLVVSAPLYLPTVASHLLKEQGVVVESVQIRLPGINSWIIKKVQLRTTKGLTVDIETMILRFTLPDVFGGRLEAVDIESLQISRRSLEKSVEAENKITDNQFDLSSFSQDLKSFPVGRLYIRQGLIDEKVSINGVDFQVDEQGLRLDGLLKLDQQEIIVNGELGGDDQFTFSINAGDSQLTSQGQLSDELITGTGSAHINVTLINTWMPEEAKALSGSIDSKINFSLQINNNDVETSTQFSVAGELSHPQYFENLKLNQALTLTGSMLSPDLSIASGDTLVIKKLQQPFALNQVTVGLTRALELKSLNQGLNVEQSAALRFRSDNDEIDVVFNGKRIAINGQVPSINPGFYISSDLEVLSFSPLSIKMFKDSQLSFGRLGDFKNLIAKVEEDFQVSDQQNSVQLENTLSLRFSSEKISLDTNTDGSISPLDLTVLAKTDRLNIGNESFGAANASVQITEENEEISVIFETLIAGLDVVGSANINTQTKLGQLKVEAAELRQLDSYLSAQCIEINSGSANVVGSIDSRSGLKMTGNFDVKNTGLVFQDNSINNINVDGKWSFGEAGEGFSIETELRVPEVDIGILVEELNTQIRYKGDEILIDKLQGNTLGGRLYGVNLRWFPSQAQNELQLYADGIDLRQLVALEDYDGLNVSGRINASLPLVIDSAGVQVMGGKIDAVQPGGEIHLPVDSSTSTGAQKEAFEALQNFHFETLSGGISGPLALDPNGLLVSNLTLRGTNPDMGRPVSLNLSIEQNTYPIFQTLELFDKINRIGQCSK